ncbi:MAG: enoyl-CoA hydratase [Saprospiraceae bacterium]
MEKLQVEYRYEGQVVQLTLNDGKGNVLDSTMMRELHQVLDEFKAQEALKAIVLCGSGKHFSFGASVEEHRKDQAPAMLSAFHSLIFKLAGMHIPLLSLVSGQCLGGGLEVVLMSNVIYADTTARLGQPEINLGVFPPPASLLLPLKLGFARAEEVLLTGRTLTAEKARELGLVNQVFDSPDAMKAAADEWLEKYILPKSASSLRFVVQAFRMPLKQQLEQYLPKLETLYLQQLMATHDANEGIASFLEKRKPEWVNG